MNIFDLTGRTASGDGFVARHRARHRRRDERRRRARFVSRSHAAPKDLPEGATFLNVELDGEEAPRVLAEKAFEAAPELSVLVCNAGSFFDVDFLEMTSPRNGTQRCSLNVRAPYFLIQTFAKKLIHGKARRQHRDYRLDQWLSRRIRFVGLRRFKRRAGNDDAHAGADFGGARISASIASRPV